VIWLPAAVPPALNAPFTRKFGNPLTGVQLCVAALQVKSWLGWMPPAKSPAIWGVALVTRSTSPTTRTIAAPATAEINKSFFMFSV
jgi:hypothetical protein